MEIVETTALISINATLLAVLVSFLLFLFVFNRLMIRPIREKMARRQTRIVRLKREIGDLNRKAEQMLEKMAQANQHIHQQANHSRRERRREGRDKAKHTLQQAHSEINSLRHEAQVALDRKVSMVRDGLESRAQELAHMILNKVFEHEKVDAGS